VTNTGTANSFVVNDASGDTTPFVIDASGNVGIGAAPSDKFHVEQSSGIATIILKATASVAARINFQTTTDSNGFINYDTGAWKFFTNNAGSATERFRINATGETLPLGQLLVTAGSASACGVAFSGDTDTGIAQLSAAGANTLSICTNSAERVRVDASGNVGIGTGSGRVVTNYTFLTINNTSGSYVDLQSNGTRVGELGAEPGSLTLAAVGASIPLILRTNDAARVTVGTNGSVTAPNVYGDTVGATNRDLFIDNTGKLGYVSSIRASKTGITSIDDVSWLRNLTPVSFHYRKRNEDGTYSDEPDGTLDYGLIAEEVEPVAPEMCFYDVVNGEPQLRGVHYSKLITPMLRYIQQLEARIAALEERNHA